MAINDELLNAQTLHSARLEFLKNGIVRKMLSLLAKSDAELSAQLTLKIQNLTGTAFSIERIEQQLASIYALNRSIFGDVSNELDTQLSLFAEYEAEFQQNTFTRILPPQVSFTEIAISQVYASAVARPFQGKLLKEWMDELEADTAVKIRDAVRLGVIQNETTDQIVRRIRGTRANGYKDGLLAISRRNAQSIVRTAVQHTARVAQESVVMANESIFNGEQWHSTLDSRTTPFCQAHDGKVYAIGDGPQPPAHINCRSVRIPLVKSWRELGIDADELPASTRASMNGQVPDDLTYGDWLRKQPVSIQDEVMGIERARLFRESGEPITKFVNREGKYYTLEQLRKMEL